MSPISHSRPCLGIAEQKAVADVIASGMLIGGDGLGKFKSALARVLGRSPFLFSSGRKSIFAGLGALNLPPNSEVVVQTYVCDAVGNAIRASGLIPRYCDIDDRWSASANSVAAVFNRNCSAIILAPPFGFVQTAEPFRKFGVPILNDLCQAAPDALGGQDGADFGDVAALSFHPTKYLCAGLGAAVDLTGQYSNALATLERQCVETYPLYETQIAIGIAQLSRLDEFSSRRRSLFAKYVKSAPSSRVGLLADISSKSSGQLLRFPLWAEGKNLQKVFSDFLDKGVIVRSGVDTLAHRRQGLADSGFPSAIDAINHTVSVPFYPALSDEQAELVSESLGLLS